MTHKEIINLNNESEGLRTATVFITNKNDWILWRTGLSKFLEQCCIIQKAYLQKEGDNYSFILHGKNGNVILWSMVDQKHLKPINVPLPKEFLLEGDANAPQIRKICGLLPTSQNSHFLRKLNLMLRSGRAHRVSYCIQSAHKQNQSFEVGVNAFSIPMPVLNIKNNANKITTIGLNTNRDVNYAAMKTDALKKEEIPLITFGSMRTGGYRNVNAYSSFNLICRNNKTIAKKPSNIYKLAKIKILYELPLGQMHSSLKGAKKKAPFGKVDLHYDTTGDKPKFSFKTSNEDKLVSKNPLDIEPIYFEKDEKGKAQINYRQWFDNVQSGRANSNSYNNMIATIGKVTNVTELVGVNHRNLVVYGIKYIKDKDEYIMLTTIGCNQIVESDDDVYEATVIKKVKRGKKKVTTIKQKPIEEPNFDSPIYKKWRIITDKEFVDRNEQIKTDVTNVFTKYISSGQEITKEDTDEFTKLLALEGKTN